MNSITIGMDLGDKNNVTCVLYVVTSQVGVDRETIGTGSAKLNNFPCILKCTY